MKVKWLPAILFVAAAVAARGQAPADVHVLMMQNMDDPRGFIADRHDIAGYTAVGWWFMTQRRPDEALAVIREGLAYNPRAFQLTALMGQIHFRRARDEAGGDVLKAGPAARESINEAKRAYTDAALMGIKVRAETDTAEWTRHMEQDLLTAARMAVLIEKLYGDPQTASTLGILLNSKLGGDPVLERQIE